MPWGYCVQNGEQTILHLWENNTLNPNDVTKYLFFFLLHQKLFLEVLFKQIVEKLCVYNFIIFV